MLIKSCLHYGIMLSADILIFFGYQHVTAEGVALVQQAEDAASKKVIAFSNKLDGWQNWPD